MSQLFSGGSDGKEFPCNVGDLGSSPGFRRSLEKGMATYSSILSWRIPWTKEHGGLKSIESKRVGHEWSDLAHTHLYIYTHILNCKKIKPGNPKGNQSWIFIRRIDAEAETPVLWPPDVKFWLIRKDPDAGKDWGQEEKGMTGWDGWMASPTQWTWVWVNSGSWW